MKRILQLSLGCLAFVVSLQTAQAQVKIGGSPTTIGTDSNLEVEATNGKKVIVRKSDGTLVIENTPNAVTDDKFLKIDAAGNVKKLAQFIPIVKLTAQNSSGSVTLGTEGTGRMSLTPGPNYVSLYDAVNKEFTVPETGLYLVSMGGLFKSSSVTPLNIHAQIYRYNGTYEYVISFVGQIQSAFFSTGHATVPFMLTAGDKIFMQFVTNTAQTVTYEKLNLILMRVD